MNFTYQLLICNGYYDMTKISMGFSDFEIVTVERNDCRINF